jgi:large subunit ribosomal protein L6
MSKLIFFQIYKPIGVSIDFFRWATNGVVVRILGAYGILYYIFLNNFFLDFKNATKFYLLLQPKKRGMKKFLGLIFTLFLSAIRDVSLSYRVVLRVRGVGFKIFRKLDYLCLEVGYSHLLNLLIPQNIFIKILNRKNTRFLLQSLSRQYIREYSEYIKSLKKPNEYTLKGIHYKNEILFKKPGKQQAQQK